MTPLLKLEMLEDVSGWGKRGNIEEEQGMILILTYRHEWNSC